MPDKLKPRYFVAKPGRGGITRYFWQPKKSLREAGWQPRRLAAESGRLGDAIEEARARNAELDAWREGESSSSTAGSGTAARAEKKIDLVQPNSLAHVIRLYRDPENGILMGVCAGIADYFGVAPAGVRIAAVSYFANPFLAPCRR